MTHAFTTADADRLLGLADQFLSDWADDAIQSGNRDQDYEKRNDEWQAIRPLLAAAPELLQALVRSTDTMRDILRYLQAWNPEDIRITSLNMQIGWNEAAIAKVKGAAEAATPTCADRAAWAEKAVTAYAHAKEGREYDPVADMASDLFTDLCHLLVREGISPDLILERAKTHYEEECAEEGIII